MPELDSVRGLAVMLVLFLHGMAPPLHKDLPSTGKAIWSLSQFGWIGVNLFFVLSGFLITGILVDNRARPDYYRRFYIRRALRIVPALFVTLLVLLIGRFIGWRFFVLSMLFLANCAPLLGWPFQYPVLWSLAVEEHFYLFWPAIIRRLSSRELLFLLASICALTVVLRGVVAQAHNPANFPFYTWCNLDGLSLGAMLALWVRKPTFQLRQLMRSATLAVVAAIGIFIFCAEQSRIAGAYLGTLSINVACAGFLSWALVLGSSRLNFMLDRPFLRFMGYISYGLYLVHILAFKIVDKLGAVFQPLISAGAPTTAMLTRFLLGCGLAVGLAYLSRITVEETFLRIGSRSLAGASSSSSSAKRSKPRNRSDKVSG